jgi:hypothetical protein
MALLRRGRAANLSPHVTRLIPVPRRGLSLSASGGLITRPSFAMEKSPAGMRSALHQAQLYGYLVARYGGLYRPGGNHPVCGPNTAQEMVRLGWLIFQGGRYSITPADSGPQTQPIRVLKARAQPISRAVGTAPGRHLYRDVRGRRDWLRAILRQYEARRRDRPYQGGWLTGTNTSSS